VVLAEHLQILASTVDTWATVAVAIGTLGAVAYALFRDLFLANRRRPQLQLRFDATGNDQAVVGTVGNIDAAHVRLRLSNREGKDTADDVVVIVTEVRRREGSEGAIVETTPIGLPLTWSGSSPPLTVASVHPGSERHIDLLHVNWPARDELDVARRLSGAEPVQLDVAPQPGSGQHILDSGAYEIAVEVRARNADASRYTIAIKWDGKWSGKEQMRHHLRVEPPRRRP
jgi:hypothetical protein